MQTVTCFAQTGTNRQMRLWPTTVKAAAVRPSAHISPASMCWPAGGVHLAAASASSAAAAQGPFYLPHGPHVFSGAWFGLFCPVPAVQKTMRNRQGGRGTVQKHCAKLT